MYVEKLFNKLRMEYKCLINTNSFKSSLKKVFVKQNMFLVDTDI